MSPNGDRLVRWRNRNDANVEIQYFSTETKQATDTTPNSYIDRKMPQATFTPSTLRAISSSPFEITLNTPGAATSPVTVPLMTS